MMREAVFTGVSGCVDRRPRAAGAVSAGMAKSNGTPMALHVAECHMLPGYLITRLSCYFCTASQDGSVQMTLLWDDYRGGTTIQAM